MIKRELIPDSIVKLVKTTIGMGYAISATIGAIMTMPLLAKFAIPMEVAAKKVGNIRG